MKTIGDEVMFVAEEPRAPRRGSRSGSPERDRRRQVLPDARAGLAYGSVLAREGDYYGPVVNLAHRLVEIAYPGTVLASDGSTRRWRTTRRSAGIGSRNRQIRDIGRVETWPLRAGDDTTPGDHEGSGSVRSSR